MRSLRQIEKEVKKRVSPENDIYDIRPDIMIDILLEIRKIVAKKEKTK